MQAFYFIRVNLILNDAFSDITNILKVVNSHLDNDTLAPPLFCASAGLLAVVVAGMEGGVVATGLVGVVVLGGFEGVVVVAFTGDADVLKMHI